MKKIMLFSGGLDCLLQAHFLKPDIYLYVDMDSTYSKVEKTHLKTLPKRITDKLIITPKIAIGNYEDAFLYIPFRNLYLVLTALQYGQIVYMGFNEADNAPDKTDKFNYNTIKYLKTLCKAGYVPDDWKGKSFYIRSPYKHLSKTQMIAKYLEFGGSKKLLLNLRTCYHAESKVGCGKCNPCINKAVAYINNGLPLHFDSPITPYKIQASLDRHNEWRPDSKIITEHNEALRRLKEIRRIKK